MTICCQSRRSLFADPSRAAWLVDRLREHAARSAFAVHAYCVMPDHLHVLAEGLEETSKLQEFVGRFKQETAHEAKERFGFRLWQRFFYDHILRGRDAPEAVAWYIWMNPVRKAMCRNPQDYPYSGSFTTDWKKVRSLVEPWSPPWKAKAMVAG